LPPAKARWLSALKAFIAHSSVSSPRLASLVQ
jgi:hypothetical protein